MMEKWCKRIGLALVLMLAVIITMGSKTYATDEIQLPVMVNPLYQEDAAEIELELESLQGEALGASDVTVYTSIDEAAKYVRQQMVARNTNIAFNLSYDLYTEYGQNLLNIILEAAMAHTEECSGQEGDALAFSWAGYGNVSLSVNSGVMKVTMPMSYYTTAEQEAALTKAVNGAMSSLNLSGKSDYEKVKAIHDYICDNVDYDYEHLDDTSYKLQYTAYAALVNKKSVCQGYAVLFYRMCKEAGIPVRIISGYGNSAKHAWNIVKVGDYYYNIDCTWDGQGDTTTYNYFLIGDWDFIIDHSADSSYNSAAFREKYPISMETYDINDEPLDGANKTNFNYTYTTVKDTTVTSTASGKPKVLIFFSTTCYNSQSTFKSLQGTTFNNVDIVGVECNLHTKDEVKTFAESYASNNIQFCYDTSYSVNNASLWKYVRAIMGSSTSSTTYPVIAYIDADNQLQHLTSGIQTGNQIRNNLIDYCGYVGKLSLSDKSVSLESGSAYTILAYIDGQQTNGDKYTWTSSNTKVATVDKYGKVTGVGAGTATITCKSTDGTKLTATVNVNGLASVNGKFIYLTNGVKDTTKTGLVLFDGQWFYVVKGELSNASGFVKYDGETFYVGDGRVISTANGLVEYNGEWYYVAAGRVVSEYTGLAEYNGAWFYIANGKMDPTKKGMVEYDGGLFYVGAGKIMTHVSGLAQDPVTGKWYFLAGGQVQKQHTGLALYNGAWFYVIKGEFANTYTGYVTHDGSQFYVVKGEVKL